MNLLGRRAPRPQPGPSEGEHRRDPRLAAGARGCTDGGGWEPGRRPAEPSEPGAGEAAGCPSLRAAAASLPLAVLPRRAPVSALARTRPPAAVQLGVAAVPRRPRQPLSAPVPAPTHLRGAAASTFPADSAFQIGRPGTLCQSANPRPWPGPG